MAKPPKGQYIDDELALEDSIEINQEDGMLDDIEVLGNFTNEQQREYQMSLPLEQTDLYKKVAAKDPIDHNYLKDVYASIDFDRYDGGPNKHQTLDTLLNRWKATKESHNENLEFIRSAIDNGQDNSHDHINSIKSCFDDCKMEFISTYFALKKESESHSIFSSIFHPIRSIREMYNLSVMRNYIKTNYDLTDKMLDTMDDGLYYLSQQADITDFQSINKEGELIRNGKVVVLDAETQQQRDDAEHEQEVIPEKEIDVDDKDIKFDNSDDMRKDLENLTNAKSSVEKTESIDADKTNDKQLDSQQKGIE